MWSELDQLLRNEDDKTKHAPTPYAAAIMEYRVVMLNPNSVPLMDKCWAEANGHSSYDAQNPFRYQTLKLFQVPVFNFLCDFSSVSWV